MVGLWILRTFLTVPWLLVATDMIWGSLGLFFYLPYSINIYRRAREADSSVYIVLRESFISLGRLIAAILVGVIYLLGESWSSMVFVGILGLLLMNTVVWRDENK
jgi:predicted MFS family arabinose efflux permease